MEWISLLREYQFLIETVYTLIVVVGSAFIAWRFNDLFRLSSHEGLRHYRDAFLLLGVSFIIRYGIYGVGWYRWLVYPFFAFFICLAGFTLLRSALWRQVSRRWWFFMLPAAFLMAFLDVMTQTMYFMYFSQMAVFTFGAKVFYDRYEWKKKASGQLPLLTMILFFFCWVINFLAYVLQGSFVLLPYYAYALTSMIMVILVFGLVRLRHG